MFFIGLYYRQSSLTWYYLSTIILKSTYKNTHNKTELQIVFSIKCNGIVRNGFLMETKSPPVAPENEGQGEERRKR